VLLGNTKSNTLNMKYKPVLKNKSYKISDYNIKWLEKLKVNLHLSYDELFDYIRENLNKDK
jgi:hypothetical protein